MASKMIPAKQGFKQQSCKNTFKWDRVSVLIHEGITQLYNEDTCTDFSVEVEGKTFRCHKVVLAAVSDYFKAMFSSGMKEVEHSKATLQDVSAGAFEVMLNILYPSKK